MTTFTLSVNNSTDLTDMSIEQIQAHIGNSIVLLNRAIAYNQLAHKSIRDDLYNDILLRNLQYYAIPGKGSFLSWGELTFYKSTLWGGGPKVCVDIEDANRTLNYLIEKCEQFNTNIQSGELTDKNWFVIVEMEDLKEDTNYRGTVTAVTMPRYVKCDVCGNSVKAFKDPNILIRHQNTVACAKLGKTNKLKEEGYVSLSTDTSKLANLCKKGRVNEAKLLVRDYEVWVPQWIVDANVLFEQNAVRGKYCGKTLEEFLAAMSDKKGKDV